MTNFYSSQFATITPTRATHLTLTLTIVTLMTGCGLFGSKNDPEYSFLGGGADRVNSAGVHEIFGGGFERVDLVSLLVPEGLDEAAKARCARAVNPPRLDSDASAGCLIDAAFTKFHAAVSLTAPASAAPVASGVLSGIATNRDNPKTRNAIQDRVIAASDQRCNVFLNYIQRHQAATNFGLGSLTSLLAGSGAIVTGATAARVLAGSAGIVTGIRAEYDQNYFYNQTVSVISKGIRQRRKSLLVEIELKRSPEKADSYTVERAVGDALLYHGGCTIAAGLEESNTALSLDAATASLKAKLTEMTEINKVMMKLPSSAASSSTIGLPSK
jgi:hypothetical protein